MNATLTLNHQDQIALFYNEPLNFTPEWASVDINMGEIYIGGKDVENRTIKLERIDKEIYGRIEKEARILLVQVKKDATKDPVKAVFVPLMISRQV